MSFSDILAHFIQLASPFLSGIHFCFLISTSYFCAYRSFCKGFWSCILTLIQSDPNFADKIRHIREPKARLAAVWNFCKTKTVCEPDEPKDEEQEGFVEEQGKKGHGGCGYLQPAIRKEGLKLFLQYKKVKDDDEVMC